MSPVRGIHMEALADNIEGWLEGAEQLDVRELYDTLTAMYGPASVTDWCARLLRDLHDEMGPDAR